MVLSELRNIYKVSMQELADSMSVSKQLIGQIEKGQRKITDRLLQKLVKYFGITNEITDDFRDFFSKKTLNTAEVLKVKESKINKELRKINPKYAGASIDEYGKLAELKNMIDPQVFSELIEAFSIIAKGGSGISSFTNEIVKLVKLRVVELDQEKEDILKLL